MLDGDLLTSPVEQVLLDLGAQGATGATSAPCPIAQISPHPDPRAGRGRKDGARSGDIPVAV